MTFTVTVLPDGQRLGVEGEESILDAAVRAGVSIDYGCSSGSCGRCRARLTSGRVSPVRNQDYVFTAREKADGWILLCTNTPVSDAAVEALVAEGVEEIPVQALKVKVRRLELVNDDLLILHVQTPRTQRLRFLAGQFATVSIPEVGAMDLSIASCPCDDRHLEFHLRRSKGEALSEYVFDRMRPGEVLDIRGPQGEFVADDEDNGPLILVAFDTGFAAVKSILEHVTAQERERAIHLYWLACGPDGHYLGNLCRSWRDALDEFTYTPVTVSPEPGEGQCIAKDLVRETLDTMCRDHRDLVSFSVFVCAPTLVLETFRQQIESSSAPPARARYQRVLGNYDVACLTANAGFGP